jgi:hypothetical protein
MVQNSGLSMGNSFFFSVSVAGGAIGYPFRKTGEAQVVYLPSDGLSFVR